MDCCLWLLKLSHLRRTVNDRLLSSEQDQSATHNLKTKKAVVHCEYSLEDQIVTKEYLLGVLQPFFMLCIVNGETNGP